MLGVVLVYAGMLVALVGAASLIRPLAFLAFRTRARGAVVLALGLAVVTLGAFLPADDKQIDSVRTRLDEFAPTYQFNEVHRVEVRASRARAYQALKEISAGEILFFQTLTWIRRMGRPGPESILNAPEWMPLLDVATQTTFLLLAEEPEREIVVGTVVLAPQGAKLKAQPTPEDFEALQAPGYAKATMNFRLEDFGAEGCVVTTETRVFVTDAATRRRFAAYWRFIYPGSALIRRMWLRAIQRRAEAAGAAEMKSQ